MKRIKSITATLLLTCLVSGVLSAQEEVEVRNGNTTEAADQEITEKGFKKENLFVGGGLTASFYSGGSVLGISPMLGYKLNDYLDAGVALNYVYSGSRDNYAYNDKYRQHVFGPGVFLRAYPISFLFAQAQLEHNFTHARYTGAGSARPDGKYNANATSLLLGGGYSTSRIKGGTTFFYVSILADVLKNRNSPYVDVDFDPETGAERISIVPVIRAGVNVGLFQKRYGYYE